MVEYLFAKIDIKHFMTCDRYIETQPSEIFFSRHQVFLLHTLITSINKIEMGHFFFEILHYQHWHFVHETLIFHECEYE